jgi:hypothetical protein
MTAAMMRQLLRIRSAWGVSSTRPMRLRDQMGCESRMIDHGTAIADGNQVPSRGTHSRKGPIMMTGAGGLGAVGAMSFGGVGMSPGLGGTFGGLNGVPSCAPSTMQMQQLTDLLAGFTSAEILMALMIAASGRHRKDDDQSGALAMLAGMALASQLSGIQGLNSCQPCAGSSGGMTGGQLNAVA